MEFSFNRRLVQTVVTILALLVYLLTLSPAFAEGAGEKGSQRTITVSGTGVASGPPDTAVVRLGVETRDPEVERALTEASARIAALTAALEGAGVASADIRTVDYSIGFVPQARSGAPQSEVGPAGYYRVSDAAAVTVRDLSELDTILADALRDGANQVQGVSFQIADPSPLEKRARAQAYAQAHARALQIASLSGVDLGRVLRVSAGGAPGPAPQAGFRAAAINAPGVSPGTLEVSVTLQVVYEIGR